MLFIKFLKDYSYYNVFFLFCDGINNGILENYNNIFVLFGLFYDFIIIENFIEYVIVIIC